MRFVFCFRVVFVSIYVNVFVNLSILIIFIDIYSNERSIDVYLQISQICSGSLRIKRYRTTVSILCFRLRSANRNVDAKREQTNALQQVD